VFDLTNVPDNFVNDPYPLYRRLRQEAPVLPQPDGSYVISSYAALDRIYKNTKHYSSDKKQLFKPRFGSSSLYEHHTTSLVFNDPPLHTRVRKIMVGAMTPRAIANMEEGLIRLVDGLLDALPQYQIKNEVDILHHFAAQIPINVIGDLFDMPVEERGPLREWSLAILGDLLARRRKKPGDPATDVLTRLIQSDGEQLSESELLQNCIFTLNAGHETTTNLIANAISALHDHPDQKKLLLNEADVINTAIDEFLRYESPNQLGNRVTTTAVEISGYQIPHGSNLHLVIGAANRDDSVFENSESLNLKRSPNKHLAFAGGPHACLGLNLARMEGRIAIGRLIKRYPKYTIAERVRSPRLRFRGFSALALKLNAS